MIKIIKIKNSLLKKNFKKNNDYSNDIALGKKRKGRIPKYLKEKGIKGNHDNSSDDNIIKCVFTSVKNCVHNFINLLCIEKYGIKLNPLNLQPELGSSHESYRKFCENDLNSIYINSVPKNIKSYPKELKNENINQKVKYLNENNKIWIKKTNDTLFKEIRFYDMIEVYFDNSIKFIEKDNIKIDLGNFERYDNCLNDKYDKETKERIKNKIKKILEPTHKKKNK